MKTIPEHPSYKITKDGKVWSYSSLRFLKPTLNKDGYGTVQLCTNRKQYRRYVHRLMAQTYLPNPENKRCVDHINRIRNDNRLSNLRWATHRENNTNIVLGHGTIRFAENLWNVGWSVSGTRITRGFKKILYAAAYRRIVYFIRRYWIPHYIDRASKLHLKNSKPIPHGTTRWSKHAERWQARWSMNGKCRTKTFLEHDDAERHRRLLYFLRRYIIKR